jgi:hypothetical protein
MDALGHLQSITDPILAYLSNQSFLNPLIVWKWNMFFMFLIPLPLIRVSFSSEILPQKPGLSSGILAGLLLIITMIICNYIPNYESKEICQELGLKILGNEFCNYQYGVLTLKLPKEEISDYSLTRKKYIPKNAYEEISFNFYEDHALSKNPIDYAIRNKNKILDIFHERAGQVLMSSELGH